MDSPSIAEQVERPEVERPYVSTGHLPEPEAVQKLVSDAHRRFESNTDGQNSQVYPALARVPSDLFGICIVGTSGCVYAAGDVEHEFPIMSVSKPFVFALVCETIGPEEARDKLGANATGLASRTICPERSRTMSLRKRKQDRVERNRERSPGCSAILEN